MKEQLLRLRWNGEVVGYLSTMSNGKDEGITVFLNLRMDSILGCIRFNDQDMGFEYNGEWYFEGDEVKIKYDDYELLGLIKYKETGFIIDTFDIGLVSEIKSIERLNNETKTD